MDKSEPRASVRVRRNRKKKLNVKETAKVIEKAVVKAEKKAEKPPRKAYPRVSTHDDVNLIRARKALVREAGPGAKDVLDVFNTIVMPGVGKNVRIGEEFGSRPTGVASLFNRFDTSFSMTPGKTSQCFLFKSALRYQLEAYSAVDYYGEGPTDYTGSAEVKVSSSGAPSYFNVPLTANLSGVHGPVMYPGRLGPSDPNYGYICNFGDNVRIAATTAALASIYNITMYRFNVRDWLPVETKATVGGHPVNFTISEFGYYSFAIASPTSSAAISYNDNFELILTCGNGGVPTPGDFSIYWGQTSLPGLEDNISTVQNLKFHGLSLMWTNTSNMLSKQGQIAMMQIPADSWWGSYVGYSTVAMKNVKVEANLDAQEGAYLFQKPAGIEDFSWTNEIIPSSNIVVGTLGTNQPTLNAWFFLIPPTDFITIALDIPVWGTGVDSRAGYWTARTDLEYASVDQWRSLQTPTIRKDSLEKALVLVSAAPQFHTNEFHLSDLWDWVKNAAKTVANAIVDYGPTVLKAAAFVAPLLL